MGSSTQSTHGTTSTGPLAGTKEPLLATLPDMSSQYQKMSSDPMLQQGRDFMGNVLSGKYLDPASNPYLQPYAQGAIGDVTSAFNTMAARAGRGNMTGGDMQQNLARGMMAAAAPIYLSEYDKGMAQLQGAAQMAPAYTTASYGAPLDWYRSGLMGVGSMGQEGRNDSTTTTTPSMGQYAMGGLMTAASLLNPGAGMAGAFGSPFASAGGLVTGTAAPAGQLPWSSPFYRMFG